MLISVKGKGKNRLQLREKSLGDAAVLSHFSLLRNIRKKNLPMCWSIIMTEEDNCWFSILGGGVPSDSIPKTTMNIIHINTFYKLHKWISLNSAREFREFLKLLRRYTTGCTAYNHKYCPCISFICCSQQIAINSTHSILPPHYLLQHRLINFVFLSEKVFHFFSDRTTISIKWCCDRSAFFPHNIFNTLRYYKAPHIRR